MIESNIDEKLLNKASKYTMKARHIKAEAKSITITVERLSDNSRITFTISSDKTIKQLRTLLNHHLPPLSSGKFDLYSYQRGAFIHFHPSSFKLDYFPVIFDQSILLLKMDDRLTNHTDTDTPLKTPRNQQSNSCPKKDKCSILNNFLASKTPTPTTKSLEQQTSSSSSTNVTCLTLLKQFFHQSSSKKTTEMDETSILTY